MTVSSHYTFIQCESGPNPRQISLVSRKKIRAQVMRTSWLHKKALETKAALSKAYYTPTHKSPDTPRGPFRGNTSQQLVVAKLTACKDASGSAYNDSKWALRLAGSTPGASPSALDRLCSSRSRKAHVSSLPDF